MQDLNNKKKLTLIAFGAHPDPFDMPYQAGGTLAKYAKRGHRVILVAAAHEEEWEQEIKAIATHLGCESRFLSFVEGALIDDPIHTHQVMDMIRECKADIVLTHQPTDYHPDHRALSRAVLGACLLARVGEIKSQYPVHKVGNLFYTETTSGLNSQGTIYVDVAETWQQKITALQLHKKLSEQQGAAHLDSIEHLIEREETNMKFRGFQVEREYCEAFQVAVNYRVSWAHDLLPIATLPPNEE